MTVQYRLIQLITLIEWISVTDQGILAYKVVGVPEISPPTLLLALPAMVRRLTANAPPVFCLSVRPTVC